jgi:hypothetical protein
VTHIEKDKLQAEIIPRYRPKSVLSNKLKITDPCYHAVAHSEHYLLNADITSLEIGSNEGDKLWWPQRTAKCQLPIIVN